MTAVNKLHQEFLKLSDEEKQTFLTEIISQSTGQTEISELKAHINQVNNRITSYNVCYTKLLRT